jgi:hypothetical protein
LTLAKNLLVDVCRDEQAATCVPRKELDINRMGIAAASKIYTAELKAGAQGIDQIEEVFCEPLD